MSDVLRAPWTDAVVAGLAEYQASRYFHPYTCGTDGCRTVLMPTRSGWVCPTCGYRQDWAQAMSVSIVRATR